MAHAGAVQKKKPRPKPGQVGVGSYAGQAQPRAPSSYTQTCAASSASRSSRIEGIKNWPRDSGSISQRRRFRKQTSKRAGACVAERVDCGPELSTRNFRCGVRFVVSLPSVGRLPFEPVGRLFIGLRVGVQPFRFCALQHVDGAPNSIVNGLHFGREAKHLGVGSIGDGRDGDGDRQNGGACYE